MGAWPRGVYSEFSEPGFPQSFIRIPGCPKDSWNGDENHCSARNSPLSRSPLWSILGCQITGGLSYRRTIIHTIQTPCLSISSGKGKLAYMLLVIPSGFSLRIIDGCQELVLYRVGTSLVAGGNTSYTSENWNAICPAPT